MKIDNEYLKRLLEAFEASEEAYTDIEKLKEIGFDLQKESFLFHFQILEDEGLIQGTSDGNLGYFRYSNNLEWHVVPLRLTSKGHEFLERLRNKEVWNTIKTNFKDTSVTTLVSVSKKLFEGYLQKKVSTILNED